MAGMRTLRMSPLTAPTSPNMKASCIKENTRSIFCPTATVWATGHQGVGCAHAGGDSRAYLCFGGRESALGSRLRQASQCGCTGRLWRTRRTLSPILTKKAALASSASRTSDSPKLAVASATLSLHATVQS
jgi:hypothetical protein